MGHRQTKIIWLGDILEQLRRFQQELQWTENPADIRVLTEAMLRDLESCRQLCDDMNRRAIVRQAV